MSPPEPPRALLPIASTEVFPGTAEFDDECAEFGCHGIDDDRVCLRCGKAEIYGKPYSVYVCKPCYDHLVFGHG